MAEQSFESQSADSFEFMLFEGDPDHLKPVLSAPAQINPWINPNMLKLAHRLGRGPFGDVWLATHHLCTKDYDRYREVAVKMLYPIKDDQVQILITKLEEIFSKCQGLENICFLHGITIQNGRLCIVMKFYEGSIGDKMALVKGGKLSLFDVLRYGVELAQGILEIHNRGILVLNLKPCNFLLDENDHAILGDFGIPYSLLGISIPSSDLVQRLGSPNYMAPEQWEPIIRGPISFETDSWGFGCSIVEMLTGIQPWQGKSPNEICELVVGKQVKPNIPCGLPPELYNVLHGCFEYDFRNRPLMTDILDVFKSCRDACSDDNWNDSGRTLADKSSHLIHNNWLLLKDLLQVGDVVRSRKPKNSSRKASMMIPEGTIVGMENKDNHEGFVLIRVHGFHSPQRVHTLMLERMTHGFAAGDWVRLKEEDWEKQHSAVGILHSINRDGSATAAFIGIETLWWGNHSELQMAESYYVGQFLRIKSNVSSPRFEWPKIKTWEWATGRVSQILPNGCLVVTFPGKLSFGKAPSYLADPSEVEVVSFANCEGFVKKYWHLEDHHWAVRPLVIALGLFTAIKLGFLVRKSIRKSKKNGVKWEHEQERCHQNLQDGQNGNNSSWFPPSVANMIFGDDIPPSR